MLSSSSSNQESTMLPSSCRLASCAIAIQLTVYTETVNASTQPIGTSGLMLHVAGEEQLCHSSLQVPVSAYKAVSGIAAYHQPTAVAY